MTVEVIIEELESLSDLLKLNPSMVKCLLIEDLYEGEIGGYDCFAFNEMVSIGTLYVTGCFVAGTWLSLCDFIKLDTKNQIVPSEKPGIPVVHEKRYDLVENALLDHLKGNGE